MTKANILIRNIVVLFLIILTILFKNYKLNAQESFFSDIDLSSFEIYLQDSFRITKPGVTLTYKSTSLIYPAAFDTVIYFQTIQPKYKFGDFSLAVSETGKPKDAYTLKEIDTDLFRVWTVWRKIQQDQLDYIVPDNRPLEDIRIAYSHFYEYFPTQYLKPLIEEDSVIYFFNESNNTGSLIFKIVEMENYQISINGQLETIPCIKIKQSTKAEYLTTFKNKLVKHEEEKTYWVLNNIHDPVILKREGYRVSFRSDINDPTNGFKYWNSDYLEAITY